MTSDDPWMKPKTPFQNLVQNGNLVKHSQKMLKNYHNARKHDCNFVRVDLVTKTFSAVRKIKT